MGAGQESVGGEGAGLAAWLAGGEGLQLLPNGQPGQSHFPSVLGGGREAHMEVLQACRAVN